MSTTTTTTSFIPQIPQVIGRLLTTETLVGAASLSAIIVLIVPLSPIALDVLLAVSIGLSAVVFLTSVFTERPTDFSVFPPLLLFATLVRLSLNVASTRLILLHGHEGPGSAGKVIQAFGSFVAGGNVGVGVLIFLVLTIINFVVITKGSGRIAEVAARFTLDAIPGKQMAIDADLNSGIINDQEARTRRADIERQADFYGAMDGASKFVRGDAVAGLIITAVNLMGGLALGMIQQNLDFGRAVSTYSILTVGDGLVSQMPALVVSAAAGLVISRASGRMEFGREVVSQLLGARYALGIAAVFLVVIGLLPGLPLIPFAALAGGLVLILRRKNQIEKGKADALKASEDVQAPAEPTMAEVLHVDALSLEVGYGLLPLVDTTRGGDIPDRVKKLRQQLAKEIGIVIPPVRVVDNLQLSPGGYAIKLAGVEVARGEVVQDRLLAIDSAGVQSFPNAIPSKEPVFGLSAFWILSSDRKRAEARGLTVVDPSTVIVTHLADVLRKNADQLIGRDQVHELISFVRKDAPKLIEELIPGQLTLGEVVSVLQLLLQESISIRNLRLVLETLAANAAKTRDPRELAEIVRSSLWRQISSSVMSSDGKIHVITLDHHAESVLRSSISPSGQLAPEPAVFHAFIRQAAEIARKLGEERHAPCLLVADDLRRPLQQLLHPQLADIPVVALRELDKRAELRVAGTISGLEPKRG